MTFEELHQELSRKYAKAVELIGLADLALATGSETDRIAFLKKLQEFDRMILDSISTYVEVTSVLSNSNLEEGNTT